MTTVWPEQLEDGTPYGTLDESQCKEQFSLAYAHAVATSARCTMVDIKPDVERVDFTVRQVAEHTIYSSAVVDVQMKCSSRSLMYDDGIHFSLPVDHYDDLRDTRVYNQKILAVLLVPENITDWFEHGLEESRLRNCAYWVSLRGMPPISGASTTVVLPRENVFNSASLLRILRTIGEGGYV